jgi:hypothetical protein
VHVFHEWFAQGEEILVAGKCSDLHARHVCVDVYMYYVCIYVHVVLFYIFVCMYGIGQLHHHVKTKHEKTLQKFCVSFMSYASVAKKCS